MRPFFLAFLQRPVAQHRHLALVVPKDEADPNRLRYWADPWYSRQSDQGKELDHPFPKQPCSVSCGVVMGEASRKKC